MKQEGFQIWGQGGAEESAEGADKRDKERQRQLQEEAGEASQGEQCQRGLEGPDNHLWPHRGQREGP